APAAGRGGRAAPALLAARPRPPSAGSLVHHAGRSATPRSGEARRPGAGRAGAAAVRRLSGAGAPDKPSAMKRLAILLALLLAAAPAAAQSGRLATFETAELSIETAAGERHDFTVEIAETPEQRAQGLMFRRQMAADSGMLFLFGGSQVRGMWMKNTLIPLD